MIPAVVIAGVYSRPVDGEQGPAPDDEFVVVVNMGEEPVELAGWSLTNLKQDQVHHYRYLFPRFLSNGDPWAVEPGGMVIIHTGRGRNGRTASASEPAQFHLFQHRAVQVWGEPGDTACLFNREGARVSSCHMPFVHRPA